MSTHDFTGFDKSLLTYLKQLTRNNNREWFQKNKSRYEEKLLEPCLEFIRAFEPRLKKLSSYFVANDSRDGGSLMRIYRDTRFAKDKTPYKINVGIQFRHEMGKDVHAPGYYVHIAPSECFLGVGMWSPPTDALGTIRKSIVDDPAKWQRTRDNKHFRDQFELMDDSLKSAPRGFDKNHPLINDLKLKSFCGMQHISAADFTSKSFIDDVAISFKASRPFMGFLCDSLKIPF